MQACQGRHAERHIALHLQHDYLAVTGQIAAVLSVFERTTTMAAYETTRRAPFGAITTLRIASLFGGISAAVAAWNDARVTRNALARLSDRELDDIGLCRGDIEHIADIAR
jgi:uncharacterized protein YjiS (DUF1127 family)